MRFGMSSDPLFHMFVQDVFSIAKRGTVVTGKVETGTLKVGDEIVIRGRGAEKKAVVAGIESFRKMLEQANQGDSIGVLLKDMQRTEVQSGDELVSPDSGFTWNP
jgi:elongation factor Tu